MIDLVYMPVLYRLLLTEQEWAVGIFEALPKIKRWAENIAKRASTKASVLDDFDSLYLNWIGEADGFWAKART